MCCYKLERLAGTLWTRNMSLVLPKKKKIQLSLSLNTSPCCSHVILTLSLFGGADILELVMWRWNLFLIRTKCHFDITWLRLLPRYERQAPHGVKLHHTPSYCPFWSSFEWEYDLYSQLGLYGPLVFWFVFLFSFLASYIFVAFHSV